MNLEVRIMKKMNVIVVYDKKVENVLMCKRTKEPYKGLYNLVGGKIENENDLLGEAYRELEEETGITKNDIRLVPLMNYEYFTREMVLEVYFGVLNKNVTLVEEVNKLKWCSLEEDMCNLNKFAGDRNIGHIILIANEYLKKCDM